MLGGASSSARTSMTVPRRRRLRHRAAVGRQRRRRHRAARHRHGRPRRARRASPHGRLCLRPRSHDRRGAALDSPRRPARLRFARGAHGLRHRLVPRLRGRHHARQAARVQRRARVRSRRGAAVTAPLELDQVTLTVELGPLRLEHPLVDASGTFDILEYARRYRGDFLADFPYAAYVPKTVTADARPGNPAPRVTETPAGMINAIGLENPGVDAWIEGLPEWAALRRPVIVSVGGNSPDQYAAVVRALTQGAF